LEIIYAPESFPNQVKNSIFLAGPTPRSKEVKSWRPAALELLRQLGFDGMVFVPEPRNGNFKHQYDDQVNWELEGLKRADCILFWVPRSLDQLPGFTTNVEFGYWIHSKKVVYGHPPDAEKMRYLDHLAKFHHVPIHFDLKSTIQSALGFFHNLKIKIPQLTIKNLEKLKQRKNQSESNGQDTDLDFFEIQKIIGKPNFIETHHDGLYYRDDLYIWVEPKSFIMVAYFGQFGNEENKELYIQQFTSFQEYEKYLQSLKQKIESSPYFNIQIEGSFRNLFAV
jgi:nucleoside 2-deoxyribosyltransferase